MEIQVSHLPWYPPDLQHHGLVHSSNTDTSRPKELPVLSPNLCTACSMRSTLALLLTYPQAFLTRHFRRTPWHCWPRSTAIQQAVAPSPTAQQISSGKPGWHEESIIHFTSNISSFRSNEGRNPSPREATVTPLNI